MPSSPREWRRCRRFPRYEVSSHGEVRRIDTGRLCTPQVHRDGYVAVYFTATREERAAGLPRQTKEYVHRLVAEAFLGAKPHGCEVDHIDRDPANNQAANLRWLPVSANRSRKRRAVGTNLAGLGMQARRDLHLGAGVGLAGALPRRSQNAQGSTGTYNLRCSNSLVYEYLPHMIEYDNTQ